MHQTNKQGRPHVCAGSTTGRTRYGREHGSPCKARKCSVIINHCRKGSRPRECVNLGQVQCSWGKCGRLTAQGIKGPNAWRLRMPEPGRKNAAPTACVCWTAVSQSQLRQAVCAQARGAAQQAGWQCKKSLVVSAAQVATYGHMKARQTKAATAATQGRRKSLPANTRVATNKTRKTTESSPSHLKPCREHSHHAPSSS